MSILQEFKTFALRGNMVDLAIGVIIGQAFGKIVSSLVSDVLMPPLGMLIGGVDFSLLGFTLKQASEGHAAVVVKYGAFLSSAIDFLIVAVVIFLVVKGINSLKRTPVPEAPITKNCPECLMPVPLAAKRCGHCCTAMVLS